jgi:hypothetical protein
MWLFVVTLIFLISYLAYNKLNENSIKTNNILQRGLLDIIVPFLRKFWLAPEGIVRIYKKNEVQNV